MPAGPQPAPPRRRRCSENYQNFDLFNGSGARGNGIALREPPEIMGVTVVFPFRVQGAALVVFGESERPLLAAKAVFRKRAVIN